MIKNLFLLCVLAWAGYTYAKHPVVQETMGDAEAYKIEKPSEKQEAQRSLAGGKTKKKKQGQEEVPKDEPTKAESDSEVRYWQYSE